MLVIAPLMESEVKVPAPAERADEPMSMAPNSDEMPPEPNVPTVVNDDVMMPLPKVVAVKTVVFPIENPSCASIDPAERSIPPPNGEIEKLKIIKKLLNF